MAKQDIAEETDSLERTQDPALSERETETNPKEGEETEQVKPNEEEDIETIRKRAADTKTAYDTQAHELKQVKAQLAEIMSAEREKEELARKNPSFEKDEEELSRQIGNNIASSISRISANDPDRTSKVYSAIAKEIVRARNEAKDQAKAEMNAEFNQKSAKQTQAERNRAEAVTSAKIALKENGLDPEKHFDLFLKENDNIKATDGDAWYRSIPPAQQFWQIAQRVKNRLADVAKRNEEHRKEAGGNLASGSKINKKASGEEDENEGPDSMTSALKLLKKNQVAEGNRRYKYAKGQ